MTPHSPHPPGPHMRRAGHLWIADICAVVIVVLVGGRLVVLLFAGPAASPLAYFSLHQRKCPPEDLGTQGLAASAWAGRRGSGKGKEEVWREGSYAHNNIFSHSVTYAVWMTIIAYRLHRGVKWSLSTERPCTVLYSERETTTAPAATARHKRTNDRRERHKRQREPPNIRNSDTSKTTGDRDAITVVR